MLRFLSMRNTADMKNWICYNLFGDHPDDVDTFGMVSGLMLIGFLVGCAVFMVSCGVWGFYLSFCG